MVATELEKSIHVLEEEVLRETSKSILVSESPEQRREDQLIDFTHSVKQVQKQ